LTRHELKEQLQHDQFTDAVSGAVSYASSHRSTVIRAAVALGLVLVLVGGTWWYIAHARDQRRQDLAAAMAVVDASIGPPNDLAKTFATEDAKQQASLKALSDVVTKDGGTNEGFAAQYYRGTIKAQRNDTKGAETDLRAVADSSAPTAALAKIALAQLYLGQNKNSEAIALLRALVKNPTSLVSKAQAQILLAQVNGRTNPKEAKSILQTIEKTDRGRPAVGRAADQLASQLGK
jgi:hypothetical protein